MIQCFCFTPQDKCCGKESKMMACEGIFMVKIAKFGGSSVASAEQFEKIKKIVQADDSRRFVVVSAAGKRGKDDNKVTDLLYLCYAHIKYSVSCESIFSLVEERYWEIKQKLGLHYDLNRDFAEIRARLNKSVNLDYLVSRGEYLTARLMAEYLGYDFVDAQDIIHFRYDGQVDMEKTQEAFAAQWREHDRMVIPGFYGALPDGAIKVFSRGGSDITGSIIANLIDARVYENWTDVSGILMADPRIVQNPRRIRRITYQELRELSYMGANVLHEEAIFPVKDKNIPINIRNTNEPENPGTVIIPSWGKDDHHLITGIAGKQGFTMVAVHKNHMAEEIGTVRKVLQAFEDYGISIEHIPSGIDSVSVVVSSEDVQAHLYDIIADIKASCGPVLVKVYEHIALISTVGRNMARTPGIAGRLFGALGEQEINVRMIAQGSNEINIVVGVDDEEFENALRAIYECFQE